MCSFKLLLKRPFAASLWFAASVAVAQGGAENDGPSDGPEWIAGLSVRMDDESHRAWLASIDVGFRRDTWVSLAAGRSRSPSDLADVSADSLSVGVDHRFGLVGVSATLEDWGDSDALETQDLEGSVYFQTERFKLEFAHEERDIDVIFFTPVPFDRRTRRSAGLTGESDSVSLSVGITDRMRLFARKADFDYSRNLSVLPRIDALNLLSGSTLTLANSLVDGIETLGAEVELGNKMFSVYYDSDRSAVDGGELDSLSFGLFFPIGTRADMEVSFGYGDSEVFQSGVYGGVSFLFYGLRTR